MANWPSTGNSLDTLTSEQMKLVSIGEVQYFVKHSIKTLQSPTDTPTNPTDLEYLLRYVWP